MATKRPTHGRATEDDLAALPSISDDIIVSTLRERFLTDVIYTSIGTSALVALNPHKYVTSNADSVLVDYAAEYRETNEEKQHLPPHIFQIANNAYYHMRRTSQDQSILMRFDNSAFILTLVFTHSLLS
jgi:chitin synthase